MYSAATKDIWRTVYAQHHHIFNFLTSVQSRKSNSSYLPSSTIWASGIRPLFTMTRWLIRSEMDCITQPRVQSQCNPGYKSNCLWWIFPFHADTSINTPVTSCRSHKGNPSLLLSFWMGLLMRDSTWTVTQPASSFQSTINERFVTSAVCISSSFCHYLRRLDVRITTSGSGELDVIHFPHNQLKPFCLVYKWKSHCYTTPL